MITDANLTDSERLYCSLRAEGNIPKYKCYLQAFPTDNKASAKTLANRLENLSRIRARIEQLQKNSENKNTLSRREKREFLARVIRAEVANHQILDDDLVESIIHYYNKDAKIAKTVVKLPSKLECIKIDNQMAGHNEPEKVEHTLNGGVMLVPACESLDEWEREASRQQDELPCRND